MTRPLYVGLTSIVQNQAILLQTLQSIERQTRRPDRCFLYLSEEPYLLDRGFKDKLLNPQLQTYIQANIWIELNWVPNTGPYRKLLPLLRQMWNKDCLIVTLDDDTVYHPQLLEHYESDYTVYKSCIAYRGFRFADNSFDYFKRGNPIESHLYNFATGKGGVLYHPSIFHKTGNLIFDTVGIEKAPTADDVWFNFVRIAAQEPLVLRNTPWEIKDLTNTALALFSNFNHDKNTETIQKCILYLESIGFL